MENDFEYIDEDYVEFTVPCDGEMGLSAKNLYGYSVYHFRSGNYIEPDHFGNMLRALINTKQYIFSRTIGKDKLGFIIEYIYRYNMWAEAQEEPFLLSLIRNQKTYTIKAIKRRNKENPMKIVVFDQKVDGGNLTDEQVAALKLEGQKRLAGYDNAVKEIAQKLMEKPQAISAYIKELSQLATDMTLTEERLLMLKDIESDFEKRMALRGEFIDQ